MVLDLSSPIISQKYRLGVIKKLAREIEVNPSKKEEAGEVEDLQKDLMRRSAQLDQMQEVLLEFKSCEENDRNWCKEFDRISL